MPTDRDTIYAWYCSGADALSDAAVAAFVRLSGPRLTHTIPELGTKCPIDLEHVPDLCSASYCDLCVKLFGRMRNGVREPVPELSALPVSGPAPVDGMETFTLNPSQGAD